MKRTVNMWLSWVVFVGGLLIGYIYRSLPVVIYFAIAAGLALLFWNGFVFRVALVPKATVVDAFVFVVLLRVAGMLWRGEKNPFIRKMSLNNVYD